MPSKRLRMDSIDNSKRRPPGFKKVIRQWLTRNQAQYKTRSVLDRKHIYILPTRAGLIFSVLLFAMLMTGLNYSNSLILLLTFTLAGMVFNSAWFTHRNLAGLELKTVKQEHCFAGENGHFSVRVENAHRRPHYGLVLRERNDNCLIYDCQPRGSTVIQMPITPAARGAYKLRRFAIATRMPVGLFNAWSWQTLDTTLWAFPKPEPLHPAPLMGGNKNGNGRTTIDNDGDDFENIRPYRKGDPAQHISWKHVARTNKLLVREFKNTTSKSRTLDWHEMGALHPEAKLSHLCYWVIEFEKKGVPYGLNLPARVIQADHGSLHYQRCLLELAKFEISE